MEKSETISELAKALNKFQGMMGVVVFDAKNPFFKSSYATLSAIVATAKPILHNCELSISQLIEGDGGVTTILMHNSGEYLSSTVTLRAVKDDPQGHGSAISYSRRYAYASILGIVADHDDDGNAATNLTEMAQKHATSPKVESKPLMPPTDPNEDKITPEQGKALLELIGKKGFSKDDLKEFILFQFELKSILDIKNKHLIPIKTQFSKQKETT